MELKAVRRQFIFAPFPYTMNHRQFESFLAKRGINPTKNYHSADNCSGAEFKKMHDQLSSQLWELRHTPPPHKTDPGLAMLRLGMIDNAIKSARERRDHAFRCFVHRFYARDVISRYPEHFPRAKGVNAGHSFQMARMLDAVGEYTEIIKKLVAMRAAHVARHSLQMKGTKKKRGRLARRPRQRIALNALKAKVSLTQNDLNFNAVKQYVAPWSRGVSIKSPINVQKKYVDNFIKLRNSNDGYLEAIRVLDNRRQGYNPAVPYMRGSGVPTQPTQPTQPTRAQSQSVPGRCRRGTSRCRRRRR